MKLQDSEVLLLSQMLYHLKCSSSFFSLKTERELDDLQEKFSSYLLSTSSKKDLEKVNLDEEQEVEVDCYWHEDDHEEDCLRLQENDQDFVDEEDELESLEKVKLGVFLSLDPLRVSHKNQKKSFRFEQGSSDGVLDINMDDGDEILCDVTEVQRNGESFEVNCNNGWVKFSVQKFPKSWTANLEAGVLYEVV
jgi:hypothetical protein